MLERGSRYIEVFMLGIVVAGIGMLLWMVIEKQWAPGSPVQQVSQNATRQEAPGQGNNSNWEDPRALERKVYRNTKYGYEFVLPNGYEVDHLADGNTENADSISIGSATANVFANIATAKISSFDERDCASEERVATMTVESIPVVICRMGPIGDHRLIANVPRKATGSGEDERYGVVIDVASLENTPLHEEIAFFEALLFDLHWIQQ